MILIVVKMIEEFRGGGGGGGLTWSRLPHSMVATSILLLPDWTTSRRALIARMMVSSRVATASGL